MVKEIICKYCKEAFLDVWYGNTIYCSRKCSGLARRVLPKEKTCICCNNIFLVKSPSHFKTRLYCSRKCYFKYRKVWNKGINTGPLTQEHKDKIRVAVTGKNLDRTYSYKCRVNMSLGQTKENEFTGFKLIPSRKPRTTKHGKTFSKRVLERDNYTCQSCGITSDVIRLHAHHIIPVKQCLLEGKMNIINKTSNGITLCPKCHKYTHKLMRGGQN